MEWDIIVIGAGPAGMAAAIEASKYHCKVLVLDRQPEAGGQIYHRLYSASQELCNALGKDYSGGKELIQQFYNSNITFMPNTSVWNLEKGKVYASHNGTSHVFLTRHILIATGAMERPMPIEGWNLPNVLGVGAADILLKSASLLPKGPVIVCGNGPLVLQIINHLKHFNIPLAGLVLTSDIKQTFSAIPKFPKALLRPLYLAKGMSMALSPMLSKSTYFSGKNLCIQKKNSNLELSFTTGNKKKSHILQGSHILIHEGIIPETRITSLARLQHVWHEKQRSWQVKTDIFGRTNQQNISVAGDCAYVNGADASIMRGQLAGLDIACQCGKIDQITRDKKAKSLKCKLFRFTAMQDFLDIAFSPNMENIKPSDSTVICRCENITAGSLREAIQDGTYSLAGLKSQTRCGMGNCQGRMCITSAAELIAQVHGISLDKINQYNAQIPLTPISLGEIAKIHLPPSGL